MSSKLVFILFFAVLLVMSVTSLGLAPGVNAQNDSSAGSAGSAASTGNSTAGENKTTSSGMGAAIPTP